MPPPQARALADSVYRYIHRSAQKTIEGTRWQTLNYDNTPHYHFNAFNGVAGICYFLADYYLLTGTKEALDLGFAGARWASLPEHKGFSRGLCIGRPGVGIAWMHLARVSGDASLLKHCTVHAETILTEDPGPVTDILGGAAGNGLYLLRLWEATGEDRWLEGAGRNAEWLAEHARQDRHGVYWPMVCNDEAPWYSLGFAHGLAGIAYFLTLLYQSTQEKTWASLAQKALDTLSGQAIKDQGGLNWPVSLNDTTAERCQWCHGAPGIGLAYAKAYDVFTTAAFLQTAQAAAETTLAYGDVRQNPSQCHGLAGNAELFIQLYHLTQDPSWLDRAQDFATMAAGYCHTTADGDTWQADEKGYSSVDFMCGAAGTGHFFLRLMAPNRLGMPLF